MYQLLYLVDLTPFYSPVLHALRQRVVRVSGAELVQILTGACTCSDNVPTGPLCNVMSTWHERRLCESGSRRLTRCPSMLHTLSECRTIDEAYAEA